MFVPDTLNDEERVQLRLMPLKLLVLLLVRTAYIRDFTIRPVNAFEREAEGRKLR